MRKTTSRRALTHALGVLAAIAVVGGSGRVGAQPPASGTAGYGAGASSVAQHTEAVGTAPTLDSQTWTFSGGATWNAGNTQSLAANAGTNFAIIRGRHGASASAQFNIGSADTTPNPATGSGDPAVNTGYRLNARNVIAKARYDYFITTLDALFFGVQYRNDLFAGLDFRQDYQLGYQRNVFRDAKHRLWGEIGIDYTRDNVHIGSMPLPSAGQAGHLRGCHGDPTQVCDYVSARLFIGYDNRLNEHVSLLTGYELLFNLVKGEDIRANWITAVQAAINSRLAFEFKFRWMFDNLPVPRRYEHDTQTIVSLIVTALK